MLLFTGGFHLPGVFIYRGVSGNAGFLAGLNSIGKNLEFMHTF